MRTKDKYVYIIIAKITPTFKRYKVGVAENTRQRLKDLDSASPVTLRMRYRLKMDDPYHVETLVKENLQNIMLKENGSTLAKLR